MNIKESAKSIFRLAIAIFVSFLALALVVTAALWYVDYRKRQEAKPLEEMKFWNIDLPGNVDLKFVVRTKLIDGKMMCVISAVGYPNYLRAPLNQEREFYFEFQDADGFLLYSRAVKVSDFTGVVGSDGERTGLNYQFSDYVGVDSYSRFSRFDVKWNLNLEPVSKLAPIDPPAAVEPSAKGPQLDHCAPDLSRNERLKRLRQHGDVRETGRNGYAAGDRSLLFSYDGSLLYCH